MGRLDKIYAALPVWAQNLAISGFGLVWQQRRYGGSFTKATENFLRRDMSNCDVWRTYQTAQLRQILVHASGTVPYYRNAWSKIVSQRDLEVFRLDDLPKLPMLEKGAIRNDPELFLSKICQDKKLHSYLTSGTTGTPLAIKFSTKMHQTWSAAYEVRCRKWAGVDHTMSRAMLGGRLVVPKGNAKPPYWRYNMAERQVYFSAFHIAPHTAKDYAEALNYYRPDYLVGYASSWFFLSRFIVEQGLKVARPKAILTSSEKLTDQMRETLEKAFGCEVFDAYSGVEACCLASECEHHRMHVSPDVGIIELLDEQGQPVPVGQPGEIVATGLLNYAQPLIRYRTGDMATLSDESCPCGRSMPILKELVGRLEDTVIGADGREMVRFHGIFVGLPHVREGQIIQEDLKRFRLRLVVTPEFDEQDRTVIRNRFADRLGQVDVDFNYVDSIERTERGKFRAVISHVKR